MNMEGKSSSSALVSVILGTFNGEKYIREQLDSILNQTYSNIEIIITDDASTDETIDILKEYQNKFSDKVKLLLNDKNVGYVKNFERGVRQAKGELIAFSDQDDYWYPNKIEEKVKNIGDNDVVYCDSNLVDESLNEKEGLFSNSHNFVDSKNPLNFTIRNCVSGHAMLFKRSLLGNNFSFPKKIPHDWWITFLASFKNGVKYIDIPLVKYRLHDSNVLAQGKHRRRRKEELNEERVNRIHFFSYASQKFKGFEKEKKVLKKISESYISNSVFCRVKRVSCFVSNVFDLFLILERSKVKKLSYAFSMFFKVR